MFDVAAMAAFPCQRSWLLRISENTQRLLRVVAYFFQDAAD
jgi:hypothetical protein